MVQRCRWCNLKNETYVRYHDEEWGRPLRDDGGLYEFLLLEPFQAGLSWETILRKRENFRAAFADFDPLAVSRFSAEQIEAQMQDSGIIRNRKKIEAAVCNAGIFLQIREEWGSFAEYLWHFTGGQVVYEWDRVSSPLSDAVTKDLKKRGMKFMGTTTVYSYLQAVGVINSHGPECVLHSSGDPKGEKV